MKKFFCAIFAVCVLALTFNAGAQGYNRWSGLTPVLTGGTNWVAAVATITQESNYPPYTAWIDCPKSENLILYTSWKCSAGTSNSAGVNFTFYRCPERGIICSNNPITMTLYPTAGGAATNRSVTNIVLNGLPYLYLSTVGNSNMYPITNLYMSYGFKN
jgi:hypothetical protein